jgi:uncharacterized membrane protein YhaH (DUF805 family)
MGLAMDFRKFISSHGRVARFDWLFTSAVLLAIALSLGGVLILVFDPDGGVSAAGAVLIALVLAAVVFLRILSLPGAMKRLHDQGKSG